MVRPLTAAKLRLKVSIRLPPSSRGPAWSIASSKSGCGVLSAMPAVARRIASRTAERDEHGGRLGHGELIVWPGPCQAAAFAEGLVEVGEDVVDVFDADGEADEFRA